MWKNKSSEFEEIRKHIETVPVIDSHQHYLGICSEGEVDILAVMCEGYHESDMLSCTDVDESFGSVLFENKVFDFIADKTIDFDKRFEQWTKLWNRTRHTSYARAFAEGLKICWGIEEFDKKSLLELQERMRNKRNSAFFAKMYKKHNIESMIVNCELVDVVENKLDYSPICKFVFDLPSYHSLNNINAIRKPHLQKAYSKLIVSLDDYLKAFEIYLKKAIDFGVVGIKDQSAYTRCIDYQNASKADAESVFNRIMSKPRDIFGKEEVKPLDDYLFHKFMEMAAKYKLPVQIHTGHMAGIRNDIMKTNPAHLTGVLELHQDVTFDLFHGGWPFMGEFLYLGKNYPNVNLDMCWCNSIDPLYSVEFFKRAVMTVPHCKINGFGGDCLNIEAHIGYLMQARDNIAIALSDLVDSDWLTMPEAKQIAKDWLHNNPKRIFSL